MTKARVEFQKLADFPTEVLIWRKCGDNWQFVTLRPDKQWIINLRSYLFSSLQWQICPLIWASADCVRVGFDYVGGKHNDDKGGL